jgi:MurNAc alpha-1-phosphate uridylyltransferase
MLDYQLALARKHGHTSVIVNAHHHWKQVAAWAEVNGVALQVELPEILGTGGGLRAALDSLAPVVTILNADILVDLDLGALRRVVPPGGASMLLRESPEALDIGPVYRDLAGRVVRITNVVGKGGIPGTHFTGIHAMTHAAISRIPLGTQSVIGTAYKELVEANRVAAYLEPNLSWFDVGTPSAYLEANLAVLRGRFPVALDPWAKGTRVGTSWVGRGAKVDGTFLREAVIGADAFVHRGTTLVRSVVWDRVEVPAGSYKDVVFYDGGIHAVG